MVLVSFDSEAIQRAPAAVRQWLKAELIDMLGDLPETPDRAAPEEEQLAACSPTQARRIFDLIARDHVLSHVLLAFGRPDLVSAVGAWRAIHSGELARHLHMPDVDHLAAGIGAINRAAGEVLGQDQPPLVGIDRAGYCFVRAETFAAISAVWNEILMGQRQATADAASAPPAVMSTPTYHFDVKPAQ